MYKIKIQKLNLLQQNDNTMNGQKYVSHVPIKFSRINLKLLQLRFYIIPIDFENFRSG